MGSLASLDHILSGLLEVNARMLGLKCRQTIFDGLTEEFREDRVSASNNFMYVYFNVFEGRLNVQLTAYLAKRDAQRLDP